MTAGNTVYVLIVVDTEGLNATENISQSMFLIDNQGELSVPAESTKLNITCYPGDKLEFRITGFLSSSDPQLTAFNSSIDDHIFDPQYDDDAQAWTGIVSAVGTETYQWTVTVNEKAYTWSPYLVSSKVINVLAVVDTESTLAQGSINQNIFWIDNQGNYSNTNELKTVAHLSDKIHFRIVGILSNTDPHLTKFNYISGDDIFAPSYESENNYWQGTVKGTGTEIYHWTITIQGNEYQFEGNLSSTNPTEPQ